MATIQPSFANEAKFFNSLLGRSIDSCSNAMRRALQLSSEDVPEQSLLEAWWFDEAYLGEDVQPILRYSNQCVQYSKIPSGVGQAVFRRAWLIDNDVYSLGDAAKRVMDSLLAKASDIYE